MDTAFTGWYLGYVTAAAVLVIVVVVGLAGVAPQPGPVHRRPGRSYR